MSMFQNFTTDGLEQSQDRLGGFAPLDTDIYVATIKQMYAGKAASGAFNVSLILTMPDGKEYKETVYISNKKGENFFIQKDSDKKSPLPGFTTINDICLIATGKELHQIETEDKIVKVWDPDTKKEEPKSVPVLIECLGQKVAVGILRQLENKQAKNPTTGEYEATEEERESNMIDKVFHPELKLTVVEARQGKQTAEFWDAWLKRNKGEIRDRREHKGDKSGAPKAAPKAGAAAAAPAPKKSLFGK